MNNITKIVNNVETVTFVKGKTKTGFHNNDNIKVEVTKTNGRQWLKLSAQNEKTFWSGSAVGVRDNILFSVDSIEELETLIEYI